MKKMKQISLLLLTMLLTASLFSVGSAAEPAPLQLSLLEEGDVICFALETTQELCLANYGFEIRYDKDAFQLTEIRNELTEKGGLYQCSVETGRAAAIFGDNITLEENDVLLTYFFTAKTEVKDGSFAFAVGVGSIADEDGKDLPWKGSVVETVYPEEPQPIPGDVNGDGKVDYEDAVLLFRHVSGQPIEAETNVLDVNEDGKVNNLDAILIFRRAAGQETETVSGAESAVKRGIAALYSEEGRMIGLHEFADGASDGAVLDAEQREAASMSVFYLDDSFVPVAEQSVIPLKDE